MASGTSKTRRPRLRIRKPLSDQDWRDWANEVHAGHMRATDMQNHRGQWITLRANTQAGVLEYFEGGEWRGLGYGGGGGAGGGSVGGTATYVSTGADAGIPNHNLLPGLQGGAPWRGEYYHFQRAVHDELGRFWDGGVADGSRNSMEKGHVTTVCGGIDTGDSLTLASTTDATKGKVYLGAGHTSGYDEASDRLGVGTSDPWYPLHVCRSGTGEARTLAYFLNDTAEHDSLAQIVVQADTTAAWGALICYANAYTESGGAFKNKVQVYSSEGAAGLTFAAMGGMIEFWLYGGAYPADTLTHVANVTSDGTASGIFPNEDSKYKLGSEVGPNRWAGLSVDQAHIATGLSLLWLGNGIPVIAGGAGAVSVLTAARGDLIVGNSVPAWGKLAKGTSGYFLKMIDANDPGWATLPAASDTVAGIVELATGAETTTGTDATRAVTPDGLAGSGYGKRIVHIKITDDATAFTMGDGKHTWTVPPEISGWNLTAADAAVTTAGTGATTVTLYNVTDSQHMLQTGATIDTTEYSSYTGTRGVPNTSYDDVATGDRIRVDIDAAATGAKGLEVILVFQLP